MTLVTEMTGQTELHPTFSAEQQQSVLHALARVAAAKRLPLQYAGYLPNSRSLEREVSAPLSFVHRPMIAEVVGALQQSLWLLAIRCSDFELRHWDILCSLHRVTDMTLSLGTSHCLDWPAYEVEDMQLTSLLKLSFRQCTVSLQPMLEHLSALTLLTGLHFHGCSHSWSAVSDGMPPLHFLVQLTIYACDLRVLPPLAQLVRLEVLNLDNNAKLRDVQLGLRGLTSLKKLSMRSSTPIRQSTLIAVQHLPVLRVFDVRGHNWTPADFVSRLQSRVSAWDVDLIL